MDSPATWEVEENRGKLNCGALGGAVVIEDGRVGFYAEQWAGRKVDGVMVLAYLRPSLRARSFSLAESYARGGDFVATFSESDEGRVTPQLYWRASSREGLGAVQLELVVSVRTELLDSQPSSSTLSSINPDAIALHSFSIDSPEFYTQECAPVRIGEVLKWRPGIRFVQTESNQQLFVFRLRDLGFSFAQFVHPSDFVAAELSADMQLNYCLSATLFPERLEKGVIRRGRVCGWFMPVENDLETAVRLAREFVEEPLPLTA